MSESHGISASAPFTESELSEFQDSDVAAGRVIVLLLTSIFTIGLLLYSYIAWVV